MDTQSYTRARPQGHTNNRGKTRRFEQKNTAVEVAVPEIKPVDRGMPRPWRIALQITQAQVQLVFDLTDSTLIGRAYPENELFHGIDLTPFNAYDLGLSREHATFKLDDDRVVIIDNNSANGTLLNEERLEPDRAYLVRHGDLITLGMMKLKIELLMNPFEL